MRAGTFALPLLAAPLNNEVLESLREAPRSSSDLLRIAGASNRTALRSRLRPLTESGLIENGQGDGSGYGLAEPGREILWVAAVLEDWLAGAPGGPLQLGTAGAKGTVEALAEGWSTAIVRALAARPLTLTELSRQLPRVGYPSLQRRLGAMRAAGLVRSVPGESRGTPYAVTDWQRRAVAPLLAAARWECRYAEGATAPVTSYDVEAAFLLTLPLVRLPAELSGSCRLAVAMTAGEAGGRRRFSGARAEIEAGRVVACSPRLTGEASSWIAGTPRAWFAAVLDRDPKDLQIGGDPEIARALQEALRLEPVSSFA